MTLQQRSIRPLVPFLKRQSPSSHSIPALRTFSSQTEVLVDRQASEAGLSNRRPWFRHFSVLGISFYELLFFLPAAGIYWLTASKKTRCQAAITQCLEEVSPLIEARSKRFQALSIATGVEIKSMEKVHHAFHDYLSQLEARYYEFSEELKQLKERNQRLTWQLASYNQEENGS